MKAVQKAKENPMVTVLVTFAAAAAMFTGAWAGIGLVDDLHTTEAELLIYDLKAHTFASQQFDALIKKVDDTEITGKCRWLKSEIRALEDSIYVRKRDNANGDFIRSLEQSLEELQDEYDALGCTLKLAHVVAEHGGSTHVC